MAPAPRSPWDPHLASLEHGRSQSRAPVPEADDQDEFSAPPIAGKEHPPDAMDEMVPTLDDSHRMFRHHPNEPVSEGFSFDPQGADAAADLAGDLAPHMDRGGRVKAYITDITGGTRDQPTRGVNIRIVKTA